MKQGKNYACIKTKLVKIINFLKIKIFFLNCQYSTEKNLVVSEWSLSFINLGKPVTLPKEIIFAVYKTWKGALSKK